MIAVRLPLEALEASRSTGFAIRFYGSKGERAVKVPAPVIDGFLQRLADFNG